MDALDQFVFFRHFFGFPLVKQRRKNALFFARPVRTATLSPPLSLSLHLHWAGRCRIADRQTRSQRKRLISSFIFFHLFSLGYLFRLCLSSVWHDFKSKKVGSCFRALQGAHTDQTHGNSVVVLQSFEWNLSNPSSKVTPSYLVSWWIRCCGRSA